MSVSALFKDRTSKLLKVLIGVSLVAGAIHTSVFWAQFGVNPLQYSAFGSISSSAILAIVPLVLQSIIVSLFLSGLVQLDLPKLMHDSLSMERELSRSKMKLSSEQEEIELLENELEQIFDSENKLINQASKITEGRDESDKWFTERQARIAVLKMNNSNAEERLVELSSLQEKNQILLKQAQAVVRKILIVTTLILVLPMIALTGYLYYSTESNPFIFIPAALISLGWCLGLYIWISSPQIRSYKKNNIPEIRVLIILVLAVAFGSSVSGYSAAYELKSVAGKKTIYSDDSNKQYVYLGVIGDQLFLYDPCKNSTVVDYLPSKANFSLTRTKDIKFCR